MSPEDEKRLADALARPGAKLLFARDVFEQLDEQIQYPKPAFPFPTSFWGIPFEVNDNLELGTFVVISEEDKPWCKTFVSAHPPEFSG